MSEEVKTQYYVSDLSHLLGLGEIVEMYVHTTGDGVKVLRVISRPGKLYQHDDEFKTVRTQKKRNGKGNGHGDRQPAQPPKKKGGMLGNALDAVFGEDRRDQKPPWM